MRSWISLFMLSALIFAEPASAEDYHPAVSRYRLDVSFYPDRSMIEGSADIEFADSTDFAAEAVCYLHGELWVDSITAAGKKVPLRQEAVPYDFDYSMVARKIRFPLNGDMRSGGVTIHYRGQMHATTVGSPSNYMRIDGDGVFLRSFGYSLWFPVFLPAFGDDRIVDFTEVTIRTPADFRSVFTGEKTDERFENGKRVSRWRAMRTSLFAAQCTARRFVTTSDGDVVIYHDPDSLSVIMAEHILDFAGSLVARYEEYYRSGADRRTSYIVEMPKYGDISSGNVTGLQQSTWLEFEEQRWAQRGLAHELVHPYVWVRPSRSDRFYSLAVEGFPSYLHLPVLAEILGREWYDKFMQWIEEGYIEKRKTGLDRRGRPLPEEKPILDIGADELGRYKDTFVLSDRSTLFFNYLYTKMGTRRFFAFTKDLFGNADIDEKLFREEIEEYLPGSRADVETWLASDDYPERLTLKHVH